MPLRDRLAARLRRHGPYALVALGIVKGVTVAAAAPLVGAPIGLALAAAALWAGGSGAAALWLNSSARRTPTSPDPSREASPYRT